MTPHLEEALLHELVDGEVPSGDLGPIQAHLSGCSECRARLEEARTLAADADGLIEALDDPAPAAEPLKRAAPRRRSGWATSLAWAATLVIAAGLGYYARGGPPAPASNSASVQIPAPPAPTPPAEVAPGAEPKPSAPQREERKAAAPAPAPAPPAARNEQALAEAARRPEPTAAPLAAAPPIAPAARDQAAASGMARAAKIAEAAAPETISFIEAMQRMGGSLRLIEGLVPERLEALGPEVRVMYGTEGGSLMLTQRMVEGRVRWQLTAPPGFPADSLAKLRARVRE